MQVRIHDHEQEREKEREHQVQLQTEMEMERLRAHDQQQTRTCQQVDEITQAVSDAQQLVDSACAHHAFQLETLLATTLETMVDKNTRNDERICALQQSAVDTATSVAQQQKIVAMATGQERELIEIGLHAAHQSLAAICRDASHMHEQLRVQMDISANTGCENAHAQIQLEDLLEFLDTTTAATCSTLTEIGDKAAASNREGATERQRDKDELGALKEEIVDVNRALATVQNEVTAKNQEIAALQLEAHIIQMTLIDNESELQRESLVNNKDEIAAKNGEIDMCQHSVAASGFELKAVTDIINTTHKNVALTLSETVLVGDDQNPAGALVAGISSVENSFSETLDSTGLIHVHNSDSGSIQMLDTQILDDLDAKFRNLDGSTREFVSLENVHDIKEVSGTVAGALSTATPRTQQQLHRARAVRGALLSFVPSQVESSNDNKNTDIVEDKKDLSSAILNPRPSKCLNFRAQSVAVQPFSEALSFMSKDAEIAHLKKCLSELEEAHVVHVSLGIVHSNELKVKPSSESVTELERIAGELRNLKTDAEFASAFVQHATAREHDLKAQLSTVTEEKFQETEILKKELATCVEELENTKKALAMDASELKHDRQLLLIEVLKTFYPTLIACDIRVVCMFLYTTHDTQSFCIVYRYKYASEFM